MSKAITHCCFEMHFATRGSLRHTKGPWYKLAAAVEGGSSWYRGLPLENDVFGMAKQWVSYVQMLDGA